MFLIHLNDGGNICSCANWSANSGNEIRNGNRKLFGFVNDAKLGKILDKSAYFSN